MSQSTPVLGLPYILPSQAQKHVTHNEAIDRLDSLVQLAVQSRSQSAPPLSPIAGDRYIVQASGSGDWAGQDNTLAVWRDTGWQFIAPLAGWQAQVLDDGTAVIFDGTGWAPAPLDLQNQPGIGLGTSYDTTNRLAVAAEATLLSHDGNGHQLKVNKASASDTASLLFQDNWSGRAEMGLAGDDNFHIKVSDDGSSFQQAITVEAQTGFTAAKCLLSGRITVASDSVGSIPTPSQCGFVLIHYTDANYPQPNHSGIFVYDTTSSPSCLKVFAGTKMENLGSTTLTGTTCAVGNSGIAAQHGELQIENRQAGNRDYCFIFLGGL
jgi:hypothetical protein